ncbi:MAG TPA: hypothetical protein VGG64_20890 [Pirellulales bacterium]|jgi:hypothetical protein
MNNAAQMQAAGVNLTLVAWLARHAKDVPTILADAENVVSAATISDKWTALKELGDIVVADLADFPGFTQPVNPAPINPPTPTPPSPVGPVTQLPAVTVAEVDAALGVIGDGHIINAIVSLVTNPQFLALLELILKLAGVSIA